MPGQKYRGEQTSARWTFTFGEIRAYWEEQASSDC